MDYFEALENEIKKYKKYHHLQGRISDDVYKYLQKKCWEHPWDIRNYTEERFVEQATNILIARLGDEYIGVDTDYTQDVKDSYHKEWDKVLDRTFGFKEYDLE